MAAMLGLRERASMDDRPVIRMADGRQISRGPSSGVDLVSRLRGPLPDPDRIEPRPPSPPLWAALEPTGVDLVDLRRELQAAKRAGVPFGDAWVIAVARVSESLPTAIGFASPRRTFLSVVAATRRAWADAYNDVGEPPRFVGALVAALDPPDEDTSVGGPRRVTSSW